MSDQHVGSAMRAVVFTDFGGPEVLVPTTVPRPEPLPTEVLVRVHAAGINPLDLRTRAGFPTPARAALGTGPHILGWDVSGTVVGIGPGEFLYAPGDEVFGLLWLPRPASAYAQYVTAPSRQFARKPASIDHDHAAALPLAGLTAWQSLTDIAQLDGGERVLIHAAGEVSATSPSRWPSTLGRTSSPPLPPASTTGCALWGPTR